MLLLKSTQKMAFGLDFSGGNVSEMNIFYSGHYWPAACMDMNNNDNYAQDTGEYSIFPIILLTGCISSCIISSSITTNPMLFGLELLLTVLKCISVTIQFISPSFPVQNAPFPPPTTTTSTTTSSSTTITTTISTNFIALRLEKQKKLVNALSLRQGITVLRTGAARTPNVAGSALLSARRN